MPKLPAVSGAQAVKAFARAGWHVDRQRGSHVVMLSPATTPARPSRSTGRSPPAR